MFRHEPPDPHDSRFIYFFYIPFTGAMNYVCSGYQICPPQRFQTLQMKPFFVSLCILDRLAQRQRHDCSPKAAES